MNPKILFLFALLLNLISNSFQIPNPNPKTPKSTPTPAHVELTNYGFPVGLLPATTVLGYAVNQTSGDFSVRLGGAGESRSSTELGFARCSSGGPSPESAPPATT
ncbi:hypothetical protein VNO77_33030 [Canavalia gladiata]|uniref:Uncharacterized protein n=1 Tax=Canavalia gladiata TaxID=3824 RepID=A0AAN9KBL6_CANGL